MILSRLAIGLVYIVRIQTKGMDMENLDYIACAVLFLGWIFIGAAVVDDGTGYIKTLVNWSLFTAIIIGVAMVVGALIWAFTRLTAIT